jgi:hypothetical protein
MMGIFSRHSPYGRQIARNRRRGESARNRLEQQRRTERRKLALRECERARSRDLRGAAPASVRLRRIALFATSLGIGALVAGPLHQPLAGWIAEESGRLETMSIQGTDRLSFEAIAMASGIAPGSHLAEVDRAEVETRLSAHPWIRAARILRLPPSTLLIRVEERRPVARLAAATTRGDDGASDRLVDASGMPFASAGDPVAGAGVVGLPRLIGGASLSSGRSHVVLAEAIGLLERLRVSSPAWQMLGGDVELHLPVAEDSEGWVLRTHDRTLEVVLGHEAQVERFDRLAALLRAELPEFAQPVRIDLRFADQAVLQRMSASS